MQPLIEAIESEPGSQLLPEEALVEGNLREGEDLLEITASLDKTKLLSGNYSRFVGATFGELQSAFPGITYIGYRSEFWDYACAAYAVSENDKACFIYQGHQSMYYGIPGEYNNNFSKIRDLHVWGLYGEIGELFPEVDRDLSIEVFGEFLGVEIENYEDRWFGLGPGDLYVFEYEGYVGWFNVDEGGQQGRIISPDTIIELSYAGFSAEFVAREKRLTDSLWLEVDPEGAAEYYEREARMER